MKQEHKDKISKALKGRTNYDEWEEKEHRRFLTGLEIHGWGAWRRIAKIVKTKNNIKCCSHANNSNKKDEWRRQYPKK